MLPVILPVLVIFESIRKCTISDLKSGFELCVKKSSEMETSCQYTTFKPRLLILMAHFYDS